MKQLIVLALAIALLSACSETPADPLPFDLKGFELVEVPGSDMKRAVLKNEQGKVLEEGTIRNGKRHGAWVVYQKERDSPRSVASYVDGVLNGPYFEFAPYGHMELSCAYANGKLHGHYTKFKSIRKTEEGNYVDGKLDGICKKYYDGRDVVQQELVYKQDKLDGETIFYNEKGEVIMRYSYKDGEKVGGEVVSKAN